MTLNCPYCASPARFTPADVFGESVICPSCFRYFSWRAVKRVHVRTTILLAEDDEMQRLLAQRLLERLGYRVIAAADGQQALVLYGAHEHEIDLILSDMEMPERSGGELYRAVRARNDRVKFVLASACSIAEVREHDDLGPSVPFIQKPWTSPLLAQVLRETLAA
jgi:two-component system, cell cycle sensor histidine kinase and response regulator CckA